jgi:sulfonate transport system substrate-binding protein
VTSRFLRPILAALLLLALAACGSSGSGTKDGSITLRVGVINTGQAGKLTGPVGYLDSKNELLPELKSLRVTKIQVASFPNGPDLNNALAGGSLDLGIYGDTPALVARGKNLPTRLISQAAVGQDAGIVTKKGGPASLKDLQGKRIAVQVGSYIHRYLLGALDQAGVRPKEIINMYTPAIVAALEKGDIDAGGLVSANVEIERGKGLPVIDVASKDHPNLLGTSATVVTQGFLDKHPGIVKAWQAAQNKGGQEAKAHWDDYTGYLAKIGGYPPAITKATTLQSQVPDQPFTDTGLKLLDGTKTFLLQQKLIATDFTIDSWVAPGAKT